MKILVYGINFYPELTGVGKYTGEFVDALANQHTKDVKVLTAPPYYPEWEVKDTFNKYWYRCENVNNVEILRCPLYVPKKPTALKRILHLLSFSFTSLPAFLKYIFWRPDVVVVVAPSLFCAPAAWFFSKLIRAKTILHIQDYEIDAMSGLGIGSNSIFVRKGLSIAYFFERFILRRFDRVSSISFSMVNKAIEKGVDPRKTLYFPNWVDTDFINPDEDTTYFRKKWGFAEDDKIVLYSGNISEKQGLDLLIDAALYFKGKKNVKFLIVGDGAHKEKLVEYADSQGLDNLIFKGLVDYEDLPRLMVMANIHIVLQKKGAADVVLPSKLTSILSAGGYSLVTAEKGTELSRLDDNFPGIIHRIEPESLSDLVAGLNYMLEQESSDCNNVAREYAINYLNKSNVISTFNDDIESMFSPLSAEDLVNRGSQQTLAYKCSWGSYESTKFGGSFQIQRITVNPGANLSLHIEHRKERWTVLSGQASVTVNDETKNLIENDSAFIPIGANHSLENSGAIPLEMIAELDTNKN